MVIPDREYGKAARAPAFEDDRVAPFVPHLSPSASRSHIEQDHAAHRATRSAVHDVNDKKPTTVARLNDHGIGEYRRNAADNVLGLRDLLDGARGSAAFRLVLVIKGIGGG